jgi:hypothetical protein
MKFFRDILTSDASSSVYDLVRVGTALALVVGLTLTVYAVGWRGDPFDLTAFGTGIGLILAAGGGAMWARRDREQEPPAGKK